MHNESLQNNLPVLHLYVHIDDFSTNDVPQFYALTSLEASEMCADICCEEYLERAEGPTWPGHHGYEHWCAFSHCANDKPALYQCGECHLYFCEDHCERIGVKDWCRHCLFEHTKAAEQQTDVYGPVMPWTQGAEVDACWCSEKGKQDMHEPVCAHACCTSGKPASIQCCECRRVFCEDHSICFAHDAWCVACLGDVADEAEADDRRDNTEFFDPQHPDVTEAIRQASLPADEW
jgi:hypothetical protein